MAPFVSPHLERLIVVFEEGKIGIVRVHILVLYFGY